MHILLSFCSPNALDVSHMTLDFLSSRIPLHLPALPYPMRSLAQGIPR